MAESHRRVEARSIIGSGMATDPDRIRDIENRAARFERDHSATHKKRFGEVMTGKPALEGSALEWVDAPPEERQRKLPVKPNAAPPDARNAASDGADGGDKPKQDGTGTPAEAGDANGTPAGAAGRGAAGPRVRGASAQSNAPREAGPRTRPVAGAANPGVAQSMGGRSRVTFKV